MIMDAHQGATKNYQEKSKKSTSLLRTFKYAKNGLKKGISKNQIAADSSGARYHFNGTGK